LLVMGFAKRPLRPKAGFARIFEAMSGLTNLTGEADGPPLHMNFLIGDTVAGVAGALPRQSCCACRQTPKPEPSRRPAP
jgi:crotonobetainyl-CoA:carnitine CoA-transferase CaiB-like acyl-CoA transferase